MVKSICICGAGTMGSGIAQVCAQSGFHTILFDVDKNMLAKGEGAITKNLQLLSEKHKITTPEKNAALNRLQFVKAINDCVADLIIEAIVENAEAKVGLFNQLAEVNHRNVIFATNTSSLSVSEIAKKVVRPERVLGIHFFNPAPIMKLVEIVNTPLTDVNTTTVAVEVVRSMGKTTVICKDAPGFIVNHVARPFYLEALRLIEAGISDIETIDKLLESAGFKMGPFKLMDLIGNDVNFAVSKSIYEAMGKPARLRPSAIQAQKVEKGELGRKSGIGYYTYQ